MFEYWKTVVGQRDPHHRAAHEKFFGRFPISSAKFYDIPDRGTQGYQDILGTRNGGTIDGQAFGNKGHTGF